MRNTELFSSLLSGFLEEDLKPATVNRLENGDLEFTIERCRGYEKALGLEPDMLLSVYLYTFREEGVPPRGSHVRHRTADAEDLELMFRLGRGDELHPIEWLKLSFLYHNNPELITRSRTLQVAFFEGILHASSLSYEKDQQIMREAIINVGDDLAPYIAEAAAQDSVRNFTAVEALGHMPGADSWTSLFTLIDQMEDTWMTHAILDSVMRRTTDSQTLRHLGDREHRQIFDRSMVLVTDPSALFIARESAFEFIRSAHLPPSPRQRRSMDACRPDLQQLQVFPSSTRREDVLQHIIDGTEAALRDNRQSEDIPLRLPGLKRIVKEGVFSPARMHRISIGVLLSSWNQVNPLSDAIGRTLVSVPNSEYGLQRSIVRLLTKMGSPEMYRHFRKVQRKAIYDENTMLSIAWALGMGSDPEDISTLTNMYAQARGPETKRAISTAAFRRSNRDLLLKISEDSDSTVSRAAKAALRDLPTVKPSTGTTPA
jgi:hypothetical protein